MSSQEFEEIVKLFQTKNLSTEIIIEKLNVIKKIFDDENNGYILDYYKDTYHKKIYQNVIHKLDNKIINELSDDIFEIIS
jgi:hypothetical protein